MTTRQQFKEWMRNQGLSIATRDKYADNTPDNFEVQQVLYSITGNKNMYSCTNQAQIRQAIQRVMNMAFDEIGHKMYSAGLKKYLKFLQENNL